MTREQFIKKWLGNKDHQYTEENRDSMRDDLDKVINHFRPIVPFSESIKLLRDLTDVQNGAPLEQHKKEWEETMEQVYDFLNTWEGQ